MKILVRKGTTIDIVFAESLDPLVATTEIDMLYDDKCFPTSRSTRTSHLYVIDPTVIDKPKWGMLVRVDDIVVLEGK